ncbi:MAG: hypothetical protein Q9M50_04190 [Methylococcales bacterium]|nr:hypothetical protein [Methylococcales bacterium]
MNSKEKILIQAKKLFAKSGFSGVSMRNIARKKGKKRKGHKKESTTKFKGSDTVLKSNSILLLFIKN